MHQLSWTNFWVGKRRGLTRRPRQRVVSLDRCSAPCPTEAHDTPQTPFSWEGCFHLCRVTGNMWQVTLRRSEIAIGTFNSFETEKQVHKRHKQFGLPLALTELDLWLGKADIRTLFGALTLPCKKLTRGQKRVSWECEIPTHSPLRSTPVAFRYRCLRCLSSSSPLDVPEYCGQVCANVT